MEQKREVKKDKQGHMKVNFNIVRIQSINSYNELLIKLESCIQPNGSVVIDDKYDLSKVLRELRTELITIACCYQEGDPEIKSVIDEAGPILSWLQDDDDTEE